MKFFTPALLLALHALTVSAVPAVDPSDIQALDATSRDISLIDADAEIYATLKGTTTTTTNITVKDGAESNSTLQTRRGGNYHIKCGEYWSARQMRIEKGIEYLDSLEHTPYLQKWRCSRVSCSWRSAIHWCNDDPNHLLELDSFAEIGDDVERIIDECSNVWGEVSGTLYHVDGWRVVVKKTGDVSGDPDC